MVQIKTFLEGFEDLDRLNETRTELMRAKNKIRRVLVDTSFGSLDNKSIITEEEKARFSKLADALDKACDLITDKIIDWEKEVVKMNIIEPDVVKDKSDNEEEDVYF